MGTSFGRRTTTSGENLQGYSGSASSLLELPILPKELPGYSAVAISEWSTAGMSFKFTKATTNLWLSVKGELHLVPLRIPREFYVHLRTPREDRFETGEYSAQKVSRTLPHDRPCLDLYKLSAHEELYAESQEHFINSTNEPNIDGVYELQVRTFQYRV